MQLLFQSRILYWNFSPTLRSIAEFPPVTDANIILLKNDVFCN